MKCEHGVPNGWACSICAQNGKRKSAPLQSGVMPDVNKAPEHGWTCFHCGETFRTVGGARDHFGAKPEATPGCFIRVQLGDERGLQMDLRKTEAKLDEAYEVLTQIYDGGVQLDEFEAPLRKALGLEPRT